MTERVRRRNSKWDLKEDSQHFPVGIRETNAWTARSGETFQDDVPKSDCYLSKAKENVKSDYKNVSPPIKTWDADESDSMSMSPGLEGWRERNRSRSPRSGSTRLHRSRSRSPLHGFRREFEGQNDRSRSGSGTSTPSCKDFAAGRCRRGGHCRFLHSDNRNYEERRYSANARGDNWRSRHEKGESFGQANSEEQATRYSQDVASGLPDDLHERNWEKHEGIRNISVERCNNFLKGRCFRGSSCKYVHDADIADELGSRERTHYKRDRNASSGHDYRRESDRTNSIPCKYFAAGNCHHGVSCRFSHENRERRPSQGERWSQKMEDEKGLWQGPKWTDTAAADSIHEHADRRSGDDVLGHGVGKQDSLWGGRKWGDETVVSDANSLQQRNGRNGGKVSDDAGRRLWEGSKCIDEVAGSEIVKPSKWKSDSDDEKVGNKAENTWMGRKWSQEAAESELRKSPEWMNGNSDRKIGGPIPQSTRSSHDPRLIGLAGQNSTWGGSNWGDKPADQDFKRPSQFLSDNSVTALSGLESKDHPDLVQVMNRPSAGPSGKQFLQFINNAGSAPTNQNSESQSLAQVLLSQEKNQEVLPRQLLASAVSMKRTTTEAAPVQQISSHPSGDAASLPYNGNVLTGIAKPPSEISVSADTLPVPAMVSVHGQSFNVNARNDVLPQSLSNFIMNAPRGPGFDLNERVDQISQPCSSPHDQNSFPDQTLKMKDMFDLKNSEVASKALNTQTAVTSEQVAQLTNLSASLAQFFGKGPQLPQLYATLNSIPSGLMPCHPNSVGSAVPAVASFPMSNQIVEPSKEYDPIGDSIEVSKSDANVQPPELVLDSIEQSKTADKKPTILLSSTGPSISGATNGGDSSNNGIMEATLNNQSQEIKQVEPAVKERSDEPTDKGLDTAHLDDIDPDGQNDEEGKKQKDAKGMRMFKFSLVETVKEILKPKWKEGQMSKEAHKTIVKKVVDKVTSAFQGAHVPQTQEKIDHYMSSSRPKLTKLVHAYVEKYLKT